MQLQSTEKDFLKPIFYCLLILALSIWIFAAVRIVLDPIELDRLFRMNALFGKGLVLIAKYALFYGQIFFQEAIEILSNSVLAPFQLFPLFWGALLATVISAIGLIKVAKAK
jgi:multisubunit Na+/H+ antiporter MnhF subunit